MYFRRILLLLSLILLQFDSIKSLKIDWDKVKPANCSGKDIVELDSSIQLQVILHITAIYEVIEERMEFGMQVFVTEIRENFELNLDGIETDDILTKLIPDHVIKCLWEPDTIFFNAKESVLYADTVPNRFYKLALPFNFIVRSSRYKIIASCSMDFHLYPMDSQRCSLDIQLLAHRGPEVELKWMDPMNGVEAVNFMNTVKPLNFQIFLINSTSTSSVSPDNSVNVILHANFLFVRSLAASIVNAYVPSFLTVCLSMVSFWLDVSAVPGRVTLGVTAILTLSTEIVHIRSSLPTLDYMTAMDIWLLGCVFMVFLSLIEFTMAQSWSRKTASLEKAKQESEAYSEKENMTLAWSPKAEISRIQNGYVRPMQRNLTSERPLKRRNTKKAWSRRKEADKDNILDRVSRFVFPLAMFSFTCVYWVHFYNQAYP